jgi:hypothetical protein
VIQIAIISNPDKISSRLTLIFAGSMAYHIGFVDDVENKFYDQNLLFRRRRHPHYKPEHMKFYRCPVEITREDLEHWLETDNAWYGVMDYLFFGIRKLFPGAKGTFKGVICSEAVENILKSKGWNSPFTNVPSPTDFEKVLEPI